MSNKVLKFFGAIGLVVILVATLVLASCGGATPIGEQEEEEEEPPALIPSVLRTGWYESPQAGMNPFLARSEADYIFLGLMYEPLCMPMIDGTIKPWIAKSTTSRRIHGFSIWMKGLTGVMESLLLPTM